MKKAFYNWIEWLNADSPKQYWKVIVSFVAAFLFIILIVQLLRGIFLDA
jgi:hypothetical protein